MWLTYIKFILQCILIPFAHPGSPLHSGQVGFDPLRQGRKSSGKAERFRSTNLPGWAPQVPWSNSPRHSCSLSVSWRDNKPDPDGLPWDRISHLPLKPSTLGLLGTKQSSKQILLPSSEVQSLTLVSHLQLWISKGNDHFYLPSFPFSKSGTKRYNGIYLAICTAKEKQMYQG